MSAYHDGRTSSGELDGPRLAEHLNVAHGTVKRWLHEGMPARRVGRRVWVDPTAAEAWLAERFKGRRTVAFARTSFVYFAQREDGAIKIGFSSDIMRRVAELRKKSRTTVELLACYPGAKPDELRLHDRFSAFALGEEWFSPADELLEFIAGLKGRAA